MHDETVDNELDDINTSNRTPIKKKFPWDYYCKESELDQKEHRAAIPTKQKDQYGVYQHGRIRAIRLFESDRPV